MSVCSTWKSETKFLFKNMKMRNFDRKHGYNFIYRNTEFSPKTDLLGRVVHMQEQFILLEGIRKR